MYIYKTVEENNWKVEKLEESNRVEKEEDRNDGEGGREVNGRSSSENSSSSSGSR